jgi:tetratricopeptide (TPR) repeat protein
MKIIGIPLVAILSGLIVAGCAGVSPTVAPHQTEPAPSANPDAILHMLAAKQAERQKNWFRAVLAWQSAVAADGESPTLTLGLARALLNNDQVAHARHYAEQALAIDSTHVPTYRFLFELYQKQGDVLEAATNAEAVVRLDGDPRLGWNLVRAYNRMGRADDAQRILVTLVNHPVTAPDDVLLWIRMAKAMELSGVDEVLLVSALRRWPTHEETIITYGNLLNKGGRQAEAERLFKAKIDSVANRERIARQLAWLLIGQERYAEADSLLASTKVESPDGLKERKAWIALLLKRQKFEMAELQARPLSIGHEDDSEVFVLLGQALFRQRRFAEAETAFARGARNDSSMAALSGLTLSQAEGGKPENAEETARAAFARYPGDNHAAHLLGVILRTREKWAESGLIFRDLVEQHPTNGGYLYNLGTAMERSGNFPAADSALRRLLVLRPKDSHLLNYLGYMYAERGIRLEEARTMVLEAVTQEPKNGAYLDTMGWVLFQQKRYEDALRYLMQASKYLKEDSTVLSHIGDVYKALGKKQTAVDYWKRALKADPKNDAIQRKIEQHER